MNRFKTILRLGLLGQLALAMLLLPVMAGTQWDKQDVAPSRQEAGTSSHYSLRSIKTGAPLHGQSVSQSYRLKWSPVRRPSDADTIKPIFRILSPLLDTTVSANPLPMLVDIDGETRPHYEKLKAGWNTVILQASNEFGISALDTVRVFLDDVPPVITNISPMPGAWITNSFLHVTYTADGLAYSRDFILAEGLNSVVLDATDSVGNATHDTVSYRLDTQAPSVVILNPSQDTSVRMDSVQLRYTVEGQLQIRWVKLISGNNRVVAQSQDSAGNVSRDTVWVRYIPGCRPDILAVPTQVAQLGQQFRPLDLTGFVTHCAYPIEQLQYLLSGNTNVTAIMSGTKMNFTLGNSNWYGIDSLRLIVQDPDGLRDTAMIHLQRKNTLTVNALVRDFKEINTIDPTNNHPDFQPNGSCSGIGDLQTRIKITGADPDDRNPVQLPGNTDCFRTRFSEWYTTSQDTLINRPFQINLTFVDGGNGTIKYTNTNFFPIDKDSAFIPVGKTPNTFGHLQASTPQHNFGFTMEFHAQFQYKRGTNQVFKFTGDDDVWVFINDSLLLDLGGIHGALTDSIKLDNLPANFLVDGQQYPLDFFSAERHTTQSNILITTSLGLSNSQSQITLDKKNYPAGTVGAQVTLVDQSNGPQLETRTIEVASSNGDTLRPVATESATFPGKFTRTFSISNGPVQLNDTILQVTAPGTLSARYIDPDFGDTTSYTSTYGPQNVVAITAPLENQLFNHSPVPVVWNVNGLSQTSQLSASLVQGSNRIIRTYTDETGLSADTVNVSMDSIPPHISGTPSPVDGNNGWYRSFATVSFTCTDETRLVFCSGPSSVTTNGTNIPIIGTARDSAGNLATSLVSISRDAVLPSLSLAGVVQVPLKGSARVTLTLNAGDSLSGLQSLTCNGNVVPVNVTPRTYQQVVSAGTQSFACSDADSAGNVQSRNFLIEVVPNQIPVARQDIYSVNAGESLSIPAPGLLLNDSDFESDTLRAIISRATKHGTSNLNTNGSLTYLPATGFVGMDSLGYRITDGNDTSAQAWVILNVLHVPMTLLITSPLDGILTNSNSVVVAFTVNGQTHSRNFGLAEGANSLVVDTLDDIGQLISDTVLVRKDGIPPVVQFISPVNGFITNQNPVAVSWTADGIVQSNGTSEVLAQGLNTITRISIDSAGNQGQASIQITLDTIAPLVKILSPIGGASLGNSLTRVSWTVDGVVQEIDTTANLVEGDNLIVRTATDAAGNVGKDSVHVNYASCLIVAGDSVHFHEPRTFNCIDVQARGSLYAHFNLNAQKLTVESGGRLYSDDTLRSDTLVIKSGGLLSHTALNAGNLNNHLHVIAVVMKIESGANVDVSGKGYPVGVGPGGQQSQSYTAGGSHAGQGYGSSFDAYGSFLQPEIPGGGGGQIGGTSPYYGAGGGVVKIEARTLILDGDIRADGETAYYGAGAGGSIWLNLSTLKGLGRISASGSGSSFGGSGGRIAAYADSVPATILANSKVTGYSGGTMYFKDNLGVHELLVDTGVGGISQVFTPLNDSTLRLKLNTGSRTQFTGDTHVYSYAAVGVADAWLPGKITTMRLYQSGGKLDVGDTCKIDSVFLEGTATLTHRASKADTIRKVLLISQYLHVAAGAKIDVSGKGFPVGVGPGGQQSQSYTAGGSHAGLGYGSSMDSYGNYTEPELPGSGGGQIGGTTPYFGAGGGVVKIVAQSMVLDGDIRADGEAAYYGAGAGGSIWLNLSTLAGAGSLSAKGSLSSYGGSGGRIAAYADSIPASIITNSNAPGYSGGTLYFKDNLGVHQLLVDIGVGGITKISTSLNNPTISVQLNNGSRTQFTGDTRVKSIVASAISDAWLPGKITTMRLYQSGGKLDVGDTCKIDSVFLEGTATLTHLPSAVDSIRKVLLLSEYVHIAVGAKVDVSGRGYPAGVGPGGQQSQIYSVGGSHGGKGYGASFNTYGNYQQPEMPGSGGGLIGGTAPYNGAGGGIVKIIAHSMILDGEIKADGESAYYGAGAGGSVWLKITELSAIGGITSIGGSGSYSGGGGRIAIDNCNLTPLFRDSLKVTGIEPGSIYLNCYDAPIVKILSPLDGRSVYKDTISVVWQAEGRDMHIDTIESLAEGPNTISRCYTANNGLSKCDSVHVRLDLNPPKVKIISPSNNSFTTQYQTTITWSVDDVIQTVQNLENLSEGRNQIIRSFIDSSGSEGADTVWVTVDTKPPVITLVSPTQSGTILGSLATILWMVDSVNQTPVLHAMDSSEANVVTLRATDSAGNKDSLRVFLYSGTVAPNLNGLPHAQAESLLAKSELDYDSTWINCDTVPTGIVFNQFPKPGETMRFHWPVHIKIARGLDAVDLVPLLVDASALTVDPLTLAAGGNLVVKVSNQSRGATVSVPFEIVAFEDRDRNHTFTPDTDSILGRTQIYQALGAEDTLMATIPIIGQLTFNGNHISVMLDFSKTIAETHEDNNILETYSACKLLPAAMDYTPKLKWIWKDSSLGGSRIYNTPVVANLNDDDGNGIIDENDIPDVLVVTAAGFFDYFQVALDGRDGHQIWRAQAKSFMFGNSAIGDLDGDGKPEIVIIETDQYEWNKRLLILDNQGARKDSGEWRYGGSINFGPHENVGLADLDGDGKSEIIWGSNIHDHHGSLIYPKVFNPQGIRAQAADLDGDGYQEILTLTDTPYNFDRALTVISFKEKRILSRSPGSLPQLYMIANLDSGKVPSIISPRSGDWDSIGRVDIYNKFGDLKKRIPAAILENPTFGQSMAMGPVFDDNFIYGSGSRRLHIAVGSQVATYRDDPNHGELQPYFSITNLLDSTINYRIFPGNQLAHGSVFDFNDDGSPEIVLKTLDSLYILDSVGTILGRSYFNDDGTWARLTVSDIDRDGHADIILVGAPYPPDTSKPLVAVYSNSSWVGARGIYNQHDYTVTNVNDNGSIPRFPTPYWEAQNTTNIQCTEGHYACNDVSASYPQVAIDDSGRYEVTARIGNGGAIDLPEGIPVSLYSDLSGTTNLISSMLTNRRLRPGEYYTVHSRVPDGLRGNYHFRMAVDDSGNGQGGLVESNETNNSVSVSFLVNDHIPVTVNPGDQFSEPGETFGLNIQASDADGDPLIYKFIKSTAGMTLDSLTGHIDWIPGANPPRCTVTVEVSDPYQRTARETFIVFNGNRNNQPPQITSTPATIAKLNSIGAPTFDSFRYDIVATDPEGEGMEYSLGCLNCSASISNRPILIGEQIFWIPMKPFWHEGDSVTLDVTVRDARGGITHQIFVVHLIRAFNSAPVFTSTPILTAIEGQAWSYQVNVMDLDNDPISITLDTVPIGVSTFSNYLQWTPDHGGNSRFRLGATDGQDTTWLAFTVSVTGTNDAPVITSLPPLLAISGAQYTYALSAVDEENDPISYTLLSGPPGMTISNTGVVQWRSEQNRTAPANVSLQVQDPNGGVASQSWQINLRSDDVPPTVSLHFSQNPAYAGSPVTVTLNAVDNVGIASSAIELNGSPLVLAGNQYTFTPASIGTYNFT